MDRVWGCPTWHIQVAANPLVAAWVLGSARLHISLGLGQTSQQGDILMKESCCCAFHHVVLINIVTAPSAMLGRASGRHPRGCGFSVPFP
jgi:hypothetical protein